MFTYQGRVTDNGTNFTGAGQFKFALVTSTNTSSPAVATANMGGSSPHEFVNGFTLISGGSGYMAAPGVTISGGGGSGATATTTVSGGEVISVNIVNPGSGYSSTAAVTIDPPAPDIAFTTYWSNDGTSVAGSEPSAAVSINVNNGLFTIVLGDPALANMTAMDAAIFMQPNLELRIWFNDGVNGFAALSPTQRLTPAPYAIAAGSANSLLGTVAASQLTGTIPAAQLGGTYSGAVTFNNGGNSFTGTLSGNGSGITNVSAGSLVLASTNNSVTAWGWNQYGQTTIPPDLNAVVALAAGAAHSLALQTGGSVVAWGAGLTNDPNDGHDYGQSIVPPGLSNVVAIAAGYLHSLAVTNNGKVVAWGAGLTNDPTSSFNFGQSIVPAGLSNVVAVSGGVWHSLGLKADGTVVAWGAGLTYNPTNGHDYGQSIVPAGLTNVTAIASGYVHNLALRSNGTVVAWGAGSASSSATNSLDWGQSIVPAGLNNVIAVAAGAVHSLALKADGTVVAWGAGTSNNADGINLGQSIVPPGLSNVVAIAAGLVDSLALKADGTVVVWGDNEYGATNVPAGLDNVVALAPGSSAQHVLALRKHSTSPVAWLDSDNTFNGNVTVNGDTTVLGEMAASDLRLDDGNLWLRGGRDQNSGLGWYSAGTKNFGGFYTGPDGPVLFGEGGGALGTSTSTNGRQVALSWNASQQVGIGTVSPTARLDLGGDSANTKLLLLDGYYGPLGLGAQPGQLRFHLSGNNNFDRFSFLNGPGGTEVLSINGYGNAVLHGSLQLGAGGNLYVPGSPENLRIIRGHVAGNGTITTGQGFTVTKTGTGAYTINFTTRFSTEPTITATPQVGLARIATCTNVGAGSAQIRTFDIGSVSAVDQDFHFIAIGPQ